MLILYTITALLIWFLVGVLCGMGVVAIDSHVQTQHRFIKYDIREVVGHNWGLFAVISLGGPLGWGVLLFAAWRGWI